MAFEITPIGGLNWDKRTRTDTDGLVIHHTGGRGDAQGVINTLNQRGFGVQYVMDRDGRVYSLGDPNARFSHMKDGQGPGKGLTNSNTIGIEVIAADDNDITDAQKAAMPGFISDMQSQYPNIGNNIFGHGEINPHKQETEGHTLVDAWRTSQHLTTPEGIVLPTQTAETQPQTGGKTAGPATPPSTLQALVSGSSDKGGGKKGGLLAALAEIQPASAEIVPYHGGGAGNGPQLSDYIQQSDQSNSPTDAQKAKQLAMAASQQSPLWWSNGKGNPAQQSFWSTTPFSLRGNLV